MVGEAAVAPYAESRLRSARAARLRARRTHEDGDAPIEAGGRGIELADSPSTMSPAGNRSEDAQADQPHSDLSEGSGLRNPTYFSANVDPV